jgi:hypothetical protein
MLKTLSGAPAGVIWLVSPMLVNLGPKLLILLFCYLLLIFSTSLGFSHWSLWDNFG